jgi:hypothetical protein
MGINYRSHFAYRIDAWDADGENVIEHLAGVEDLQVAKATYLAACQRWPGTLITLRQGTRVIEDSRQTRIVAGRYFGTQGGSSRTRDGRDGSQRPLCGYYADT